MMVYVIYSHNDNQHSCMPSVAGKSLVLKSHNELLLLLFKEGSSQQGLGNLLDLLVSRS